MPYGKGTYGSTVGRPPKKKNMQMGGMMPMEEQKINPTTGMVMKKGGMAGKSKTGHMACSMGEWLKRKSNVGQSMPCM